MSQGKKTNCKTQNVGIGLSGTTLCKHALNPYSQSEARKIFINLQRDETSKKPCKKKKENKDPNKPKRPQTAYFLWFMERWAQIIEENPGFSVVEISKKAGETWARMSAEGKEVVTNIVFYVRVYTVFSFLNSN
ncbi:hypothetical protein DPMN_015199 [Dreissena polymorpha]|uniref:HMG box domain-containing protein n=1 Tax=Dreissena polymorpha TaxID=45954 RepID=A0A9D4N8Q6_DREPO|nr:hypothetical protein DPMN_015199 [Dreissena polymorpha]